MGTDREELVAEATGVVDRLHRYQRLGLVPRDGDFHQSVFYPPLRSYDAMGPDAFFDGWTLPEDGLLAAYAHIPFCDRRCAFCHIPVVTGASDHDKAHYIDLLEREMDLWLERFGLDRIRVRSLSLGGGTPTCLPPALLERFLERFTARLDRRACTQWGVDLDPGTVVGPEGAERLELLRRFGVDRLAFGVQSLRDDLLERMYRIHDRAQVHEAVAASQAAGFKVNIELICGYPTETLDSWLDVVQEAIGMGVDEVQIYRLKVVPVRTSEGSIAREFARHPERFPSVEETMLMLRAAILLLRDRGYDETMRRFYARTPQDYSHYLHDQMVALGDQVAFGHTAYSLLRDRFAQNSRDARRYERTVRSGALPIEHGLLLDDDTLLRRAFSMPLRYLRVDPDRFRAVTGRSPLDVFGVKVGRMMDEGLIEEHEGGLRLTDWGAVFTHEIAQSFHDPAFLRFPREAFEDGPLSPYRDNSP